MRPKNTNAPATGMIHNFLLAIAKTISPSNAAPPPNMSSKSEYGNHHDVTACSADSLIARRWLGGIQGLASCVESAITPAVIIPIGCGNHQKICSSQAMKTQQMTHHKLIRVLRVYSV